MQNFIKTIINSVQSWTKKQIRQSAADWNENNPSVNSYVKNRTHWEGTKETVLVDNLTFDEYDNGNAPQCNFIPNQVYTITWNGRVYETTCYFDGEWRIIADESLGCPFYIDDDGGDALYISADDGTEDWVVSISTIESVIHKLDSKYLPAEYATINEVETAQDTADEAMANVATVATDLATEKVNRANEDAKKMDATNPVGTGSFSMNRQANSDIGEFSAAIGESTIANADHSFARGKFNAQIPVTIVDEWISEEKAGISSSAMVYMSQTYSFDEETCYFKLTGKIQEYSIKNLALLGISGYFMLDTTAGTEIGRCNGSIIARIDRKTGKYTISSENTEWFKRTIKAYAEVVGNGTADDARSNAHTLDWEGNAWYSGDVYVGSTSGTNKDDGSKKLATEELVAQKSQVQIITWEADD